MSNKAPILGDAPETLAAEVERFVDSIYDPAGSGSHVGKLAAHYKVNPKDLASLLLERGATTLDLLTDYKTKGSPEALHQILRRHSAQVEKLLERCIQTQIKAEEALSHLSPMISRAHQVVAKLETDIGVATHEPNSDV